MRDFIVVLIFVVSLTYALRDPFIGLILYFWISIMNPHRYTWGFTYNLPLAKIAAIVVLLGVIIHYQKLRLQINREIFIFLLFWFFMTITTFFSFYPDDAWRVWGEVSKIFLMTFLTFLIVNTRSKLIIFSLSLVMFAGFIGFKGAIFGVLSGGKYLIYGPPDSMLADNNDVGLAMVMIAPICLFLVNLFKNKYLKYSLIVLGFSTVISAVLSYARGALLGLIFVIMSLIVLARHKLLIGFVTAIFIIVVVNLIPAKWFERMETIKTYDQDRSANMRINSWHMSYNLAKDNLLGGGFDCFTLEQYSKYSPNPELGKAHLMNGKIVGSTAHSIYFQVMAEHGFLGFSIFVVCLFSVLLSLRRIIRLSKFSPAYNDLKYFGNAYIVSIITFMISGAFYSEAYFDLFWAIFASAVCFKLIVYSGNWMDQEKDVLTQQQ